MATPWTPVDQGLITQEPLEDNFNIIITDDEGKPIKVKIPATPGDTPWTPVN